MKTVEFKKGQSVVVTTKNGKVKVLFQVLI